MSTSATADKSRARQDPDAALTTAEGRTVELFLRAIRRQSIQDAISIARSNDGQSEVAIRKYEEAAYNLAGACVEHGVLGVIEQIREYAIWLQTAVNAARSTRVLPGDFMPSPQTVTKCVNMYFAMLQSEVDPKKEAGTDTA